jgi:DNA helicase-2/ATP-dependent DNA helicase PcrA
VHDKLPVIKKHANFRSDLKIVDCLNRIRPELKQFANNEGSAESDVKVYLTNSWQGTRGTGAHKIGSLPDDVARQYFEATKNALEEDGWNLQPSSTKILLLTNSMLAREQGYEELLNCYPFPYTDQLLRKEDVYINFIAEVVEPASQAYRSKKYGAMFAALGKKARIRSHSDKLKWTKDMDELITLMETGSVGDVVDLLSKTKRPRLPERVSKREEELRNLIAIEATERTEDDQKKIDRLSRLRAVKYSQVSAIVKYIDGDTPFSTKHKVKGAEFENVLVVFSQGWSKYNFNKMLAWQTEDNVPETDKDQNFFEDNRNLFYVVCSRPKKRLALLFTHELDVDSVSTLQDWFGATSISEASLT